MKWNKYSFQNLHRVKSPGKVKLKLQRKPGLHLVVSASLLPTLWIEVKEPNKHTTLFWRPYNVHNVKTTSYGCQNDVICVLGRDEGVKKFHWYYQHDWGYRQISRKPIIACLSVTQIWNDIAFLIHQNRRDIGVTTSAKNIII